MEKSTYKPALDRKRLNRQSRIVLSFMLRLDGWATLAEISAGTREPEASISARLRDLANKYGYKKDRRRRGEKTRGVWEYRISIPAHKQDLYEAQSLL